MKITEKRLRSIIKSIIQEVKPQDDHALLTIDGPMSGTGIDFFSRKEYHWQKQDRVLQLFKAWCNKNRIKGQRPDAIVRSFESEYDYTYDLDARLLTHDQRIIPNKTLRDALENHARLASELPDF